MTSVGARVPTPREAARAAGMSGADTAVVVDVSQSHAVHLVRAGTTSCVVKQVRPGVRGERTLAAEAYVYRLAGWLPALTAVVPRALLVDEQRGLLVLEECAAARPGDPEQAAAVGRALAAVHVATRGVPIPHPASSGVLHLADADPGDLVLATGPGLELAHAVARDPELAALLRSARALWAPSCLVHADLKWDNVLVAAGAAVRLVDWELSGYGDPAWDVACWLAHAAAPGGPDAGQAALVAAYAAGAGADSSFWSRCARYLPARLVHLALEWAEAGGEPGDVLAAARRSAGEPDATAARLLSWAGA